MEASLFKIPRTCNRVRAWAEYKQIGSDSVTTLVWITFLHDQAPLTPMGFIDGDAIVEFKQQVEGWERVQPYPNDPILNRVYDFIRPGGYEDDK